MPMTSPSAHGNSRTIFLIDGWSAYRRSLRLFVEAAGHGVIGEADSLTRAVSTSVLAAADVVIIDPGAAWVEVAEDLAKLRRAASGASVVLVTAESLPSEVVAEAVQAGISSYLTKRAGPADILNAISVSLSSGYVFVPRQVVNGTPPREPLSHPYGLRSHLTRREQEILMLAAAGHSNGRIAEILWVAAQTVKFHLADVYRKLGVRNRAEAVEAARRLGLT
jgi:DNA-binding NarL/FixJ family response regulator